jgi:PQQ-dependent dehydrogenase (methanol/ethanol family)
LYRLLNRRSFQRIARAALLTFAAQLCHAAAQDAAPAGIAPPAQFGESCSVCHGDGGGTDRAPALIDNRQLRGRSEADIARIIHDGRGNMPSFAFLPAQKLQALAHYVHGLNAAAFDVQPPGDVAAGERLFSGSGRCLECHTMNGRGAANGPDLSDIARQLTLSQLSGAIQHPDSRVAPGYERADVTLRDGTTLHGIARNRGSHTLDLQTADGRLHLLSDDEYTHVDIAKKSMGPAFTGTSEQRRDLIAFLSRSSGVTVGPNPALQESVPAQALDLIVHPRVGDWPTYAGTVDGNRYSVLDQINLRTVSALRPEWVHPLPYTDLETTPLVMEGVMYVTGPNQVYALDARSGGQIWAFSRARSSAGEISGDAAKGANRGVAILGNRVFFITDNAHLLCLHRLTGALLWEVSLHGNGGGRYGGTPAPLIAGNRVLAGVSGGDEGIRGFVAAFEPDTGAEAWRFWTVPKAGEPGSETWSGAVTPQGGSTWSTGSYDARSGLVYISTGNPYPDTDGDQRGGDNLYTNSDLALEASTGKLRWYFQYTPHDVHDWDANQPVVLVDAQYHGQPRKLLLHANRNGFFYVLDRTSGQFLQGSPFIKRLTWASGIGADGRPILIAGNEPTAGGVKTCPAVRGATNWYSTAYTPSTGLYYVMAVEDCTLYRKAHDGGYGRVTDPAEPAFKVLRALSVDTGRIAWEVPLTGPPERNYSGVLSTAGGLVFFGETTGGFAAVDASTGRYCWHFEANQPWKGSPMTYSVAGRQYIAIASGSNILSFALPETRQTPSNSR